MKPNKTMNDVQAVILTKTIGELNQIAVVAIQTPRTYTKDAELFVNALHGISLREQRGQPIDPDAIAALGMVFAKHCATLLARGIDPLTNQPTNRLEIN